MLSFRHIRTIVDKEWAEVFKNKMVLFTIVLMPLLFTALPLIMLFVTTGSTIPGGDTADLPEMFLSVCGQMDSASCMQVYVINQFLILYMMLPLIIPITIAAYSIVGEKTTRSLEPLLATPISTEELLIGKALAAAIPAVGATWLCFFIFQILIPLTGASQQVARLRAWTNMAVRRAGCRPVDGHRRRQFCHHGFLTGQRSPCCRTTGGHFDRSGAGTALWAGGGFAGHQPAINAHCHHRPHPCGCFPCLPRARLFQRETILTRWK